MDGQEMNADERRCEECDRLGWPATRQALVGIRVVWGVRGPKPIIGAPAGKQRLRMRGREPAKLFIKTSDGIRCFHIKDEGDHWSPFSEIGRNRRAESVASISEEIFEEYQKHRRLYSRLAACGSEQQDATFKALRSIAIRLAEELFMEAEYGRSPFTHPSPH